MKSILQSGETSFRKKRFPIVWTGQNAQHVAENHFLENSDFRPNILETQKALQRAESFSEKGKNRIAFYEDSDGTFEIVWIEVKGFAQIKTAIKTNSTPNRMKKRKGISEKPDNHITRETFPTFCAELESLGIDPDFHVRAFNKYLDKRRKRGVLVYIQPEQ